MAGHADDSTLEIHEAGIVPAAGEVRSPSGRTAGDDLKLIHVIRPGIGRGKGRHLYEADMLEKNAGVFTGWRMFVDHQAPEAKAKQNGLPRSVRDLGGRIVESWWDPAVPADPAKGHGRGAVVALAKPVRLIRSLIDDDPQIVETSISAHATGVKPVQVGGQRAWAVEGFRPKGSVDWVTEAGAGGKVVSLMESTYEGRGEEEDLMDLFESMTDEELVEHLKKERPEVLELVEGRVDKEVGPVEITAEVLTEALQSDEAKGLIEESVAAAVTKTMSELVVPRLAELIESALEDEHQASGASARVEVRREIQLRDLRDAANEQIAESKLPPRFQEHVRAQFELVEGVASPALDVEDEKAEDGTVTKTAAEVLSDNVAEAIKEARELQAAAFPTKVRGQGVSTRKDSSEGDDPPPDGGEGGDGEKKVTEARSTGSEKTDALLQEAGVPIDDDLYAGILS